MRAKAAAAIMFIACVVSTPAFPISEVDANFSLLLIGSTPPPTTYGGPSPIVQLIGASLPIDVAGPFFLEPTLELFGTSYEYAVPYSRPVPTDPVNGPAFFVLGTLITFQSGIRFPVSETVALGGSLGLDFLLRFPLDFTTDNPQRTAGKDPSLAYFFSQGRFFYPETRLFVRWQVSQSIGLAFSVRAYYPLFHLWDGEGLSFFDQFMLSAGVGFAFSLR